MNLFDRVQGRVKIWALLVFSLSKGIRVNQTMQGLLRVEPEMLPTGLCFEYLVQSWWPLFWPETL